MTVDEEYNKEVRCSYKDREYLVRDNGAIFRAPKDPGFRSKYDGVWTFGEKDMNTGYMFLASSIRVHQVVCTAFHGPAPMPEMVVDHIDTNRCNNRPENLRWLTRLENALANKFTRNKIIFLCGSVEAYLEDTSILRSKALPPNISWMRTVTKAEAEACKKHLDELVKKKTSGEPSGEGLGEYVFQSEKSSRAITYSDLISKYPRAELEAICQKQYAEPMWECQVLNHTEESLFPSAPSSTVDGNTVIGEYRRMLHPGADFLISRYYKLVVVDVRDFDDGNQLRVLTERPNGERMIWYIFEIWTDGKVLFHQKVATFSLSKEDKAYDAFNDLSTAGKHSSGPGSSFYCVREKGRVRIRSGSLSDLL